MSRNGIGIVAPFVPLLVHRMDRYVVVAPLALDGQTGAAFRRQAVAALEELHASGVDASLVVDVSGTTRIDSAGLGALLYLQARAGDLRRSVVLRGVSEELRYLLVMTGLDDRFVVEGPTAG